MYHVTLLNQSSATLTASNGQSVAPGATWQSGRIGSAWVRSDAAGPISFLDIGDKHIGGDSTETWGVLVSYQGEEVVARYEGEGQLQVTLNPFFQASLTGMHLRQVQLSSLLIS